VRDGQQVHRPVQKTHKRNPAIEGNKDHVETEGEDGARSRIGVVPASEGEERNARKGHKYQHRNKTGTIKREKSLTGEKKANRPTGPLGAAAIKGHYKIQTNGGLLTVGGQQVRGAGKIRLPTKNGQNRSGQKKEVGMTELTSESNQPRERDTEIVT